MPKLIWEQKLQEFVKRQQRFSWSVRDEHVKVLIQRYYQEINKFVFLLKGMKKILGYL